MTGPGSWLWFVVAVVLAFVVGSISPATMIARRRQGDLRLGSGNPGATNAGRLLGLRYGVVVGVLDVLKGLVPALLALWLLDRFTAYAVGLAAVLGHMFSPFLRGRGGKGVATSLGAVLALLPWFALVMVVLFGLVVWAGRWVALASLCAAAALIVLSLAGPVPDPEVVARTFGVAIGVLVVIRHQRNIRAALHMV
ncbi:glycerol-3-phosphate acyltransferase [Segeticoccus rhizosphaerae]|uniref:glycerol-3-phosphate acyltransferase n=1 Tax=Segeticoccus rhizosphaerae TaxID=1104777 RepID=UPI001EE3CA7A|nr:MULTISPECIES: glycerol-3-phosphate acyltransferase [Intrasporangiaceae]